MFSPLCDDHSHHPLEVGFLAPSQYPVNNNVPGDEMSSLSYLSLMAKISNCAGKLNNQRPSWLEPLEFGYQTWRGGGRPQWL